VRERVARGEQGAAVVGRRHLLSREALQAELARRTPGAPKPAASIDLLSEYRTKKRRSA
jgi:hypothetical protein